jgi:hypothetical protein
MDYFERNGFYTYLYAGSVLFMLYLFFYVLRVKYSGKLICCTLHVENGSVAELVVRLIKIPVQIPALIFQKVKVKFGLWAH